MRRAMPYPCMGWSSSVFRMSMSSVPWTSPLGLSPKKDAPLDCQEDDGISTLDCQEERKSIAFAVRCANGWPCEKDRADFRYTRFAPQGSCGSAAWVGADYSCRGCGEVGDSGGIEKARSGRGGAGKRGYGGVGERITADGSCGRGRRNDLCPARCAGTGFRFGGSGISDCGKWALAQAGEDGTRRRVVHQPGKCWAAQVSIASDRG